MLKPSSSLALLVALVCSSCGASVFAQSRYDSKAKGILVETLSESHMAANDSTRNEKLKASVLKLVADARAGKVASPSSAQIKPAPGNNLSKGAKIAMGVGIAAAVVVVVLIIRKPRLTGPVL